MISPTGAASLPDRRQRRAAGSALGPPLPFVDERLPGVGEGQRDRFDAVRCIVDRAIPGRGFQVAAQLAEGQGPDVQGARLQGVGWPHQRFGRPVGERQLKGFSRAMPVFRVTADDAVTVEREPAAEAS